MGRTKAETDSESTGQLSRSCPRCIRGCLIPDGLGSLTCLNCGYTTDLAGSESPSKKVPLWLFGERHKRESGGIAEKGTRLSTLSPREREILDLVAKGYKNQQIADKLNWRVGTVDQYMNSIFRKLQIGDTMNKRASAITIYLTANTSGNSAK